MHLYKFKEMEGLKLVTLYLSYYYLFGLFVHKP
jgi:hypothetical protein